jgi:hypothetical protein
MASKDEFQNLYIARRRSLLKVGWSVLLLGNGWQGRKPVGRNGPFAAAGWRRGNLKASDLGHMQFIRGLIKIDQRSDTED